MSLPSRGQLPSPAGVRRSRSTLVYVKASAFSLALPATSNLGHVRAKRQVGPPAALSALPYLASLRTVFQFLNNGTLPLVVITLQRPVTALDLCSARSDSALPHWSISRMSTSAQPHQFSDTSGFHGYVYEIFDRRSACDSIRERTMLSPMASFGKSGRYSPDPILHVYLPALQPSSYASVVAFAVCQGSTSHVYLLTSATYTDRPSLHVMLYHPAV